MMQFTDNLEADKIFVIAEAGVNHNGSLEFARKLVDVAAESGADAVKFQTFSADRLVTKKAAKAGYQINNTGDSGSQYAMLKALELSTSDQLALRDHCRAANIEFMSSPFDREAVRFLANDLGVSRLKIPSGEVVNGPLLLEAWRTGLPLILSTGMCEMEEILEALALLSWAALNKGDYPSSRRDLAAIRTASDWLAPLRERIWLLQCTTQYPADPALINLRVIETLARKTGLVTGFSDHSLGTHIPLAAAGAGARVLEKHFTLSREMEGPDHAASLEPEELKTLVRQLRDVEQALGSKIKTPAPIELENRVPARSSVVAACDLSAGTRLTIDDLEMKRPGNGIGGMDLWALVGKELLNDLNKDEVIQSFHLLKDHS